MDAAAAPALGQTASHLAASYSTVRTTVLEQAAGKLGISIDRLRAELEAGKPLAHIAALAGISMTNEAAQQAAVVVQEPERTSRVDLRL